MNKQCVTGAWLAVVLSTAACGAHSFTAGLGGSTGSTSSSGSSVASSSSSSSGSSSSTKASSSTGVDDEWRCNDPQLEFKSKSKPCTPAPEAADPTAVYLPDGRLDKRAESGKLWTVLEGFSPDEATRRARAAGFPGQIEVGPLAAHDPACKPGTVCRAEPFRWEFIAAGTLTLLVNPTLTISTPN